MIRKKIDTNYTLARPWSVLVDYEIKELLKSGALEVTPLELELVNPASLDFRLGSTIGKVVATGIEKRLIKDSDADIYRPHSVIDPRKPESFKTETFDFEEYVLMPGEFIIASTAEVYNLAGLQTLGIAAKVMGKSSLGRLGVANSQHVAGWIDPKFPGPITLEINNFNSSPIVLTRNMKIGQIIFYPVNPPEKAYDKTGRYANQQVGTGSKGIT